jgi:hypothetical protein
MKTKSNDFDAWIELADEDLALRHIPIPDRAFKAVCLLIEWGAIKFHGAKDDQPLLEQAAFAHVHRLSHEWFKDKYRNAATRIKRTVTGVVLFSGVPFELRVPTQLNQVEEVDKTAWLIFAVDVQPEEDPRTWVVSPPNTATLSSDQLHLVQNQVVKIGTSLRSIELDLMTKERSDLVIDGMAYDIVTSLMDAARHILDPAQTQLRLACWDAHQAAEKILKAISRQLTETHQKGHELKTLYEKVPALRKVPAVRILVEKLPTAHEIIKLRTNEGKDVGLLDAMKAYRAAILLVRNSARAMPRKIGMRNARILLNKAPFAV